MNCIRAAVLVTSASLLPIAGIAQTGIAPPVSPLLVSYEYWPVQYVQWVGTELPYSMLELDTDTSGKAPLYRVVLTERATRQRIEYMNDDALVAMATARGEQAHKTNIAFEAAEGKSVGASSTLRMTLADGKPLQWRFVQGSDISEQGSGLTPVPDAPYPVFAYREEGAVAGEGTALQIGDVVSTAEMWKEISQPPYFIAYRGAMSTGAHMAVFMAGEQAWTVSSAPSTLKAGSVWELVSKQGDHRTLRVEKADGAHYVISGSDQFSPAVGFVIEATRAGDAWSVERVRYAPSRDGEKHFMSVQFAPAIGPGVASSNADIMVGKKTHIATATLAFTGDAGDRTATLQMQTPAWARGKALVEETTVTPGSIVTVAKKKE